jgi:hypothetical protein
MSEFINVAAKGYPPLYIDPGEISAVILRHDANDVEIYRESGLLMRASFEKNGIDLNRLMSGLNAGGPRLHMLDISDGSGAAQLTAFIDPACCDYAAASEPQPILGMKTQVVVGVRGHGMLQSYGVEEKEAEAFVQAFLKNNPRAMEIPRGDAGLFYGGQGIAAIDPKSVTRMEIGPMHLYLGFEKTPPTSLELAQPRPELQIDMDELRRDNPGLQEFELFDLAFEKKGEYRAAPLRQLARAIAAKGDGLFDIPGAQYGAYVRASLVTAAETRGEAYLRLSLRTADPRPKGSEALLTVRCKTPEDALRACEAVIAERKPRGWTAFPPRKPGGNGPKPR